ncbi:MAG: MFS transporter [Candidatus Microbacterium colombiense]|nr:MAG: MFS transporter [Microbacterium sp.]
MTLEDQASREARASWRSFNSYWISQSAAQVAGQLLTVAFPLIAVEVLGFGAFEASAATALQFIPYLVITPVAGVLVDRFARLPLIAWCHAGRAVLLGGCAVVAALTSVPSWFFWAVVLVAGALNAVASVGTTALVPDIAPPDRLVAANSRLQLTVSIAQVVGPALAGLLVAALGAGVFAAMAVTFALSAVALLRVRARPVTGSDRLQGQSSFFAELWAGFRFVWRTPVLNVLIVQMTFFNLFEQAVLTIFMLTALKLLGFGAAGVGVVLGVGALGGVVGATIASRVSEHLGSIRTMLFATGAASVAPFALLLLPLLSVSSGMVIASIIFGFYGLGLTVFNVQSNAVRHQLASRATQGRMAAVFRMSAFSAISLGAALGGGLVEWLGFVPALSCACAGLGVVFLIFVFRCSALSGRATG